MATEMRRLMESVGGMSEEARVKLIVSTGGIADYQEYRRIVQYFDWVTDFEVSDMGFTDYDLWDETWPSEWKDNQLYMDVYITNIRFTEGLYSEDEELYYDIQWHVIDNKEKQLVKIIKGAPRVYDEDAVVNAIYEGFLGFDHH